MTLLWPTGGQAQEAEENENIPAKKYPYLLLRFYDT
jgi:hypothetical protein